MNKKILKVNAESEHILSEPIDMTLCLKNMKSEPLTIPWSLGINGINRHPQGWFLKIHIYTPSHKSIVVKPAVLFLVSEQIIVSIVQK